MIDEDGDRETTVGARFAGIPDTFTDVAALGADDSSLLDEHVGNPCCLAQQSTRVEAKINDQPFHLLFLQLHECRFEFIGGAPSEVGHADVTDPGLVVEQVIPLVVLAVVIAEHGRDLDDCPGDGDLDHVLGPAALQAERDRLPRLALQQGNGSFEFASRGETLGWFASDFNDPVPGFDAGLVSRAARQRGGDCQVGRDLNTNPAELLVDILVEFRDLLGADVVGVLVEFLEHAADRGFDQPPSVDVFDVVAFDLLERLGEHPHQQQDFLLARLGLARLGLLFAIGSQCWMHGHEDRGQQHGDQHGGNREGKRVRKEPAHADLQRANRV